MKIFTESELKKHFKHFQELQNIANMRHIPQSELIQEILKVSNSMSQVDAIRIVFKYGQQGVPTNDYIESFLAEGDSVESYIEYQMRVNSRNIEWLIQIYLGFKFESQKISV